MPPLMTMPVWRRAIESRQAAACSADPLAAAELITAEQPALWKGSRQ